MAWLLRLPQVAVAGRAVQVRLPVLLLIGAVLLCLVFPYLISTYWMRVLTTIFLFATLASALNIIAGYTGYPAFGNVVFFGLGAYATTISMTRLGSSFWVGLGVATLVCAVYAVIVGLPILRLRGHYFAVATLGMNEGTRALVENLGLTGGGRGLSLPMMQGGAQLVNTYFYFVMLALLAAVVAVTYGFSRSRFGYGCRAIKFDEEAAASCGVPTTRYKIAAWLVSAVFTGLVGGLYAHWFGYIEPAAVFDMTIAVKVFVMMLLGGAGTIFGPLYGAFVVELIGLVAWSRLLTYHSAVLGLIIIAVVIFIPGGLMSLAGRRLSLQVLLTNIRQNRL